MNEWFEWLDVALRISAGASVVLFGGMALAFWVVGLSGAGAIPLARMLRYLLLGAALCATCVVVLAMARWPHQAAAWLPLQPSHAVWVVRVIVYAVGVAGMAMLLRQWWQIKGH
ncbi:hypothetical protein ACET47_08530 [Pseudomonas aeruginosa]|uniref:hypothetical protein n=1 Tax=Pseudomonas aeruginosa TaxID=287 RepID=UPI0013CDFAC5|nr:hypothetical protein [Pseudomonas aeruginosa]